jgi:2-(1,2-epoxy-1,2-dihydrophenyl)acetyl-CoA isomerase
MDERREESGRMIDLSVHDGVAEIVLNAPEKLNALDP